jgi:hypothetical protein
MFVLQLILCKWGRCLLLKSDENGFVAKMHYSKPQISQIFLACEALWSNQKMPVSSSLNKTGGMAVVDLLSHWPVDPRNSPLPRSISAISCQFWSQELLR